MGSSVDRPELVGASIAIRRRSALSIPVKVFGCLALLVCAACLLAPGHALAGTLDQRQIEGSGFFYSCDAANSCAQTFTAGLSGGLDQVDLPLGRSGDTPTADLSVEIRDVSGGAPGSLVLASQSVPASVVPVVPLVIVSINFAPPAPVVAGTQYAIVAYSSTSPSTYYTWDISLADAYAGGRIFNTGTSPPTSAWTPASPERDHGFTTYVVPSMTTTTSGSPTSGSPTGLRAAALAKCKHKHSKKKRRKCRRKASLLPV